jgi:hypothetical protein
MNENNYRPFWRNRPILRKVASAIAIPVLPFVWAATSLFAARGDLFYAWRDCVNEIRGKA